MWQRKKELSEEVTFKPRTEGQKDPAMRRSGQESDQVRGKGTGHTVGTANPERMKPAEAPDGQDGQTGSWLLPEALLSPLG